MASLISVLIPAYNAAAFVHEAIDSALAQDYQPLEIVVVDDGSSDDTVDAMARYGDAIRLVHHRRNCGLGATRNTLIHESKGDLLAMLDADDAWLPGKLTAQVRLLQERPRAALCHTASELFGDESGDGPISAPVRERIDGSCFDALVQRNGITVSTVLLHRRVLPAHGVYPDLHGTEDYALWMEILANHEAAYLPQVTTRYRRHRQQMTSDKGRRAQVFAGIARLRALQAAHGKVEPPVLDRLRTLALDELQTVTYSRYHHRDFVTARRGFAVLRSAGRQVPFKHRLRATWGAFVG